MVLFSQLPSICQGKILQQSEDLSIENLLLDSRKAITSPFSLFFAIGGERHDGHRFVQELYSKGIRQFIIEDESKINLSLLTEANVLLVKSAVNALQQIAIHQRHLYKIPVIGITGSNAKTILKEWLSQLLAQDFFIVKSPRSFNSQVGVPLSVWQMNERHELGIFEAGISKSAEMQKLQPVIDPTIGLFTNIGEAHAEGFSSVSKKVEEKLALFVDSEIIFYCRDHEEIHAAISKKTFRKTFSWSATGKNADANISVLKEPSYALIDWKSQDQNFQLHIIQTDDASIENILHCVAILLHLGVQASGIQERIDSLRTISMRLELKEAINHCYVIDDTYNNDPAGLQTALDFLNQQKQRNKKTVILSDLLEAGISEKELYKNVNHLLKEKGVNRLIGIGKGIISQAEVFSIKSEFYKDTEGFLSDFDFNSLSDELILVKGARIFQFEKIVQRLQEKHHGTVLEINLDALAHNLNYYRSLLRSGTRLMAMVKSFAYGSGSYEVASLLEYHRIDYLAVAYADEGVDLRKAGISLPIMVMNPAPNTFETLIRYRLEPELYSKTIFSQFLDYLVQNNQTSGAHIAIDTGMHRLGFEEYETEALLELLKKAERRIRVLSVFSHLVGADEAEHNEFSKEQIERLNRVADKINQMVNYPFMRHICNSAGIVRFPEAHMGMVRLGIGLYGVESSGIDQSALRTVGTLKTIISQIKHLKKGETIGYSRKGKAEEDISTATIAIGYGDGYSRRFSNGVGKVLINGKLAPIIGNVCMDMCMVNITGINAKVGDEVILFNEEHSIIDAAASIGTISYEILTNISGRVKRVFYSE